MSQIPFDDLADRLVPEALDLFRAMAAAHLGSTGNRLFLLTSAFSGTDLDFQGKGSNRQFSGVDEGALANPGSTGAVRLVGLARPPERPPDMGECR